MKKIMFYEPECNCGEKDRALMMDDYNCCKCFYKWFHKGRR